MDPNASAIPDLVIPEPGYKPFARLSVLNFHLPRNITKESIFKPTAPLQTALSTFTDQQQNFVITFQNMTKRCSGSIRICGTVTVAGHGKTA